MFLGQNAHQLFQGKHIINELEKSIAAINWKSILQAGSGGQTFNNAGSVLAVFTACASLSCQNNDTKAVKDTISFLTKSEFGVSEKLMSELKNKAGTMSRRFHLIGTFVHIRSHLCCFVSL